jgi:hypothetical protein
VRAPLGVVLACLALLTSGLTTGQAAPPCRGCKDTGWLDCASCSERKGGEDPARFCSIAIACTDCAGTLRLPCEKCQRVPRQEWTRRAEENRAWQARQAAEVDPVLGRALAHAESAHFRLTFDIPKIDAPGGGDLHGALHVYLARLEELFGVFVADASADTERDFLDKTRILMWNRAADQERASAHFTRNPSSTESKLLGKSPVVSIFYDREHLHEEYELHEAVAHQVAHCLSSNVWDGIWVGNIRGGWLDEGYAHVWENARFDGVRHYCYVEQDTLGDFRFGRWEASVRQAVDRGEDPPFLQVAARHTADLAPEEHMFAWSFVDFLLRAHPGAFGRALRAAKQKKGPAEVLAEALGLTPGEFQAAWRAFVRESYSLKKKR